MGAIGKTVKTECQRSITWSARADVKRHVTELYEVVTHLPHDRDFVATRLITVLGEKRSPSKTELTTLRSVTMVAVAKGTLRGRA